MNNFPKTKQIPTKPIAISFDMLEFEEKNRSDAQFDVW